MKKPFTPRDLKRVIDALKPELDEINQSKWKNWHPPLSVPGELSLVELSLSKQGAQREPPFPMSPEEAWLDSVIRQVNKDAEPDGWVVIQSDLRKAVDLSPHRASLAELVTNCAEVYFVALADYNLRRDPAEWAEFWQQIGEPRKKGRPPKERLGEFWQYWKADGGNSGRSRTNPDGPPITPLRAIVPLVRSWWQQHVKRSFEPKFSYGKKQPRKLVEYDLDFCNPAARLMINITTWLDSDYDYNAASSAVRSRAIRAKSAE
ncbi:hypothetical protein [Bradyrhizobium brasilense]|uniref:Uncharacterized protein n=1 Tax=Bradyrhizobium brasilense TaxID=1419277 RepID=A0ABY8JGW1_9BRAD|nr:hypothetical protein [Bradyrhizobium brasilense]WFU64839.1 hypothetical protein QA636_04625 [Bradyrhizobium brasilense]